MSVAQLVCQLLGIYILILIARAVCSWFPVTPGTPFARVVQVLYQITEPVLAPFRRVIPAVGMFDLSFLVAVIVLQIVRSILCPGSGGLI